MKRNAIFNKLMLIVLGGLVLCFYAFYNNYPLLYPDTGAYMYTGFMDGVPHDRPKTYGLFLRHVSLAGITWLVVFAQGLIVSTLIYFLVKYFLPKLNNLPLHFIFIAFLTFFTGVSVTVSMLIPDVFTPIFLLSFGLLLIAPVKSKRDIYLISFFLWLGIVMHNSHVLIAFTLVLLLTILALFKKQIRFDKTRLIRCWAIIGISILSIPTIHYITAKEFVLSKGSHIFTLAHLIEVGVVDDFLKKNCAENEYTLCAYQGEIPTNFIWDYQNSPLYKVYGKDNQWEDSREEYNKIIKEILSTPKYLKILAYKSLTYTAKQFFSFDTGDTDPQLERSTSYGSVSWFYQDESREFLLALQQRRNHMLDYSKVNNYQKFLFFFSLCLFLTIFYSPAFRQKLSYAQKMLLLFVVLALLTNAFICSNFSTITPRYQSRIIWILPLISGIFLIELIPKFYNQLKDKADA